MTGCCSRSRCRSLRRCATCCAMRWEIRFMLELVVDCRIIQADRLIGSTAISMPGPISGPFLLGSKCISIALLVALPLLAFGALFGEITFIAIAAWPLRAELQLLTFFTLLAAITSSLVAAIVAGVALVVLTLAAPQLIWSYFPKLPIRGWLDDDVTISLWLLAITFSFLSRRRVIPLAIAFATPFVSMLSAKSGSPIFSCDLRSLRGAHSRAKS